MKVALCSTARWTAGPACREPTCRRYFWANGASHAHGSEYEKHLTLLISTAERAGLSACWTLQRSASTGLALCQQYACCAERAAERHGDDHPDDNSSTRTSLHDGQLQARCNRQGQYHLDGSPSADSCNDAPHAAAGSLPGAQHMLVSSLIIIVLTVALHSWSALPTLTAPPVQTRREPIKCATYADQLGLGQLLCADKCKQLYLGST